MNPEARRLGPSIDPLARRAGVAVLALVVPGLAGPILADDHGPPDADTAIAHAESLSAAFEFAADRVSPAVVNITAVIGGDDDENQPARREQRAVPDPQQDPFGDLFRFFPNIRPQMPMRRPVQQSMGSGIVVSADGYILTNNHVIDNASKVEVTLSDDSKYVAKIVGADPATDVAVIKIDGADFPHVTLGDSDAVRVGQWVVAIGNPFGLNRTVTAGIVSAKNRVQKGPGQLNDVQYQDFIQTDAAINRGNSGGPLINLRGEVIGVNSAIIGPANVGIGFAIPSNMARGVMDSLIANGKVERGYLGVNLQTLTDDIARTYAYDLPERSGVIITEVAPESPADKAGFKMGDIITRYEGRSIDSDNALRNAIAATPPGKSVNFDILREGKKMTITASLASRSDALAAAPADEHTYTSPAKGGLGITVETLTPELADRVGERRTTKGVVVTEVLGRAAAGALNPGDVIIQVMNQRVETAGEFADAIKSVDLRRGVRLIIRQNGQTRWVVLRSAR
ncbi:MAG: Do family serine endopeptidase [Phycisphaerales bacterium]